MVALSSIYFNDGHSEAIANGGIINDNHHGVSRKIELKTQIKIPASNAIDIINLTESNILRVSPVSYTHLTLPTILLV